MRTALFSDKERIMVKHFLETGGKPEFFRVLEFRMRAYRKQIIADYELMINYFTKSAEIALAQGGTEA